MSPTKEAPGVEEALEWFSPDKMSFSETYKHGKALAAEVRRLRQQQGASTAQLTAQTGNVAPQLPHSVETNAGALGGWCPIESAPAGEVILFCDSRGNRWIDVGPDSPRDNWIDFNLPPVCWMPLPKPPKNIKA